MSEIDQVADAVAAALNAGGFALGATALRVAAPLVEGDAIDALTVYVVPKADEVSVLSREATAEDLQIDVGVFRRLAAGVDPKAPAGNAAVDPLVRLCRRIATTLFEPGGLAAEAIWLKSEYPLLYDQEKLRTERLFAGVVTLHFRQ